MMIHTQCWNRARQLAVVGCVLSMLGALGTLQAKEPLGSAKAEQQREMLLEFVARGDDLWHDSSLGSNGLACGNCHPDAAASNPQTWPKYQTNLGKVGTLRDMINWCIVVPMAGKPLALDSDDMIAMEAYATYMHRGVAIAPAKDEQHGGTIVISGPGYPKAGK